MLEDVRLLRCLEARRAVTSAASPRQRWVRCTPDQSIEVRRRIDLHLRMNDRMETVQTEVRRVSEEQRCWQLFKSKAEVKERMDGQKRERQTMYCSKSGNNMGLFRNRCRCRMRACWVGRGVEQHWMTRVGSQLFAMLRGEACMAGVHQYPVRAGNLVMISGGLWRLRSLQGI